MLLVPYFPCLDNFMLRLRIELLSFHKSVRRKGDICVSGALENRSGQSHLSEQRLYQHQTGILEASSPS
jgi:hypothetical protein